MQLASGALVRSSRMASRDPTEPKLRFGFRNNSRRSKPPTQPSVPVPKSVLLLAHLAQACFFRIIHAMLYRLQSAQVGEDGFQVIVAQIPEEGPRHDVGQRTRLDR